MGVARDAVNELNSQRQNHENEQARKEVEDAAAKRATEGATAKIRAEAQPNRTDEDSSSESTDESSSTTDLTGSTGPAGSNSSTGSNNSTGSTGSAGTTDSTGSISSTGSNSSAGSPDSTGSTSFFETTESSDPFESTETLESSSADSSSSGGTPAQTMAPTNPETGQSASGSSSQKVGTIITRTMGQLGVSYTWGDGNADGLTKDIHDGGVADSHDNYNRIGFDCSGLTLYVYAAIGVDLPHYTGYQYQCGRHYPASQMRRGGLLFWGPSGHGHVAIYLGDNKTIEVSQSGSVVKIPPIRYSGMVPNVARLVQFLATCSTGQVTDLKKGFLVTCPTSIDHTDLERTYAELGKTVAGQEHLIKQLFIVMLAGRHVLFKGVPGVAKALAVPTFATVMGGSYSRIQFTPDLVLSDIVGTRIFRQDTSEFIVKPGPVMSDIALADETNRAPMKVQPALLEVMTEHQMSITGESTPAPEPFLVLAAQSPTENQSVYPLPGAQQGRFLFRVLMDYSTPAEEREIIYRVGATSPAAQQTLTPESIQELQRTTREVFVYHTLINYVAIVIELTRNPVRAELKGVDRWLSYDASPRVIPGAVAAARAHVLFSGRDYAVLDDVISVLPGVLRHRLVLFYEGLADGVAPKRITDIVLPHVRLPQDADTGSDEGTAS